MHFPKLLLVLGLAACARPAAESRTPAPMAAEDSLTGVVRVVGSAPVNVQVVLQGAEGSTPLGGTLLPELRQLSGAEVMLRGRRTGRVFEVSDYLLRSVDGQPAVQGTVEARSGAYLRLRAPDGTLLYLVGAPEEFQPGQKVWVQGPQAIIVQSYGTLRR